MSDMTLGTTFAQLCRDTRIRLDITQGELADAAGLSRGYIANIESGRANPTLNQVDQIGHVLGLELGLASRPPTFLGQRRPHDLVHARCSGYSGRRLIGEGWNVAREVEVVEVRMHGWIDLLAYDPRHKVLLIVEIKTRLEDIGAIERQMARYDRLAIRVARGLGWEPKRQASWLITLASEEVEAALRANRAIVDQAFPGRAHQMAEVLRGEMPPARSLAMIDPSSRRSAWLIRTRLDGRRSPAPYLDYADAARRMGR